MHVFQIIFCLPCFILVLMLLNQSCSNLQEKIYTETPDEVHQQADKICKNIDGSQFIVRDRRVWLKKKNKREIELNHYKSILPDGYYFCSGYDRNSLIID